MPVYLPNVLFAIGQGAVIPVIALVALDLGASVAAAGAIVAIRGFGTLLFDMPAGLLVARLGERWAIVAATSLLCITAMTVATRPSLIAYAVLVFLMGCAWAVWALARLSYVAEAAPIRLRGRAMSLIGGTARIGQFAGPLLGGIAIAQWGLTSPFVIQALFALLALASIAFTTEPAPGSPEESVSKSIREVVRANLRTLGTAGLVAIAIQVLRSTRQVMIPLWGDHLGLNAGQISLVFGLSAGIDMALFYPMGILMDRRGRKWAAIPCLAILAIGMLMIPLTKTFAGLMIVGLILGLGNGLGAGINMTLGSDLSPQAGRSQFLGVWRFISDVGTAGGPLLVAAVTSIASLGAAAVVSGAVGLVGLVVMSRAVPETLPMDIE